MPVLKHRKRAQATTSMANGTDYYLGCEVIQEVNSFQLVAHTGTTGAPVVYWSNWDRPTIPAAGGSVDLTMWVLDNVSSTDAVPTGQSRAWNFAAGGMRHILLKIPCTASGTYSVWRCERGA